MSPDQVRVTIVSPDAAARSRGANGAVTVVRGVASTVATAPGPMSFTARSENVYEVPFSRPLLTTTDRAVAVPASFQPLWST